MSASLLPRVLNAQRAPAMRLWPLSYFSSLRLWLAVLVVGTMLPLTVMAALLLLHDYREAKQAANERILQTTRGTMASVDREIEYLRAGVEVLALSPNLRTGNLENFREEAKRFADNFTEDSVVGVLDASGQVLLSTTVPAGRPLPKRVGLEGVNDVFTKGKSVVTDMRLGVIRGKPVFTIDVPVWKDGKVIYDLTFSPSRAKFFDLLHSMAMPKDWIVSIFDSKGQHVARIPALPAMTGLTQVAPSLRIEMGSADEKIADTLSLEGVPLQTAFTRSSETGWTVAIGMPKDTVAFDARKSVLLAVAAGAALLLIGLSSALVLANHLLRAERNRELLVNELNHRVKNTLSTVQAVVSSSLRASPDAAAAKSAIEARLVALSHAHDILSSKGWGHADLKDISDAVLRPYADAARPRVTVVGPPVTLDPRAAITLAMVLGELVTNAVKYGALSTAAGGVRVAWEWVGRQRLRLEWRETGGPRITAPERTGYGTPFIQRAITRELGGTVESAFPAEGAVYQIEVSV